MHISKTASFSCDDKYFACYSTDDKLLVWETLNSAFIDCNFNSSVYSACTSINWVLSQHKYVTPRKAKVSRNNIPENHLLVTGTSKGDILIYNVTNKNLYMHLVGRHTDAVNDIDFNSETNSLFTCSSDKFIAEWDITSGKEKSKWKADDSAVTSICIIDGNNMLSSGSSIFWWNISEKQAIKKFNGQSAEIFKLLPVNSVSLNSCYFLSAAVSDVKINAWSLNSNENQTPVASFVLPCQPEDIDISKVFSKDKPLILSAVTKNGLLHLFEHVLNGNMNQPVQPKISIRVSSELCDASIISTKLSTDSESCIVAYGANKSNMTFKHIKIRESLEQVETQSTTINKNKSLDILPVVKETSKNSKGVSINGIKSSTSENDKTLTHQKDVDEDVSSYRRKLRSSSHIDTLTETEMLNSYKTEESKSKTTRLQHRNRSTEDLHPSSPSEILLEGLQTNDDDVIDAILYNSDSEFLSASIKNFPVHNLKDFLCKLSSRLHHHQKYSTAASKWLKEIVRVHLSYLIQSQDTEEILKQIKKHLESLRVHETICKLSVLKGFLNLQTQNSSSEESGSENEEHMEL